MGDDFGGPVRVAGGPRRGARGDRWERGYHATRQHHAAGILEHGLLLGGATPGVMGAATDNTPWPDVSYGFRPVFVFLAPSYRENYSWDTPNGGAEKPVWLQVNLNGLTLYADFWELREVTNAAVSDVGFWWGSWYPEPESAPAPLQPYIDARGVVTYEALLDDAAASAIVLSRSAALLADVEAARIRVL